jgi:acyl-coenzyme A thioesterase PaaI-like protein
MAGLNVASNHVKDVKSGQVYAKAQITHKGGSTHLWKIEITNEEGQLVNFSTLTVAILKTQLENQKRCTTPTMKIGREVFAASS